MLDLNVNITTSTDRSCDVKEVVMEFEKVVVPQGLKTQIEDSETSNSSVVNAEEVQTQSNNVRDEDSSNNSSAFIFDILKSGKDSFCSINSDKVENPSPELVTRSLFPVTGVEEGKEVQIGLGLSSRPQCLNLSFADSEGHAAELRLTQQQQQQQRQQPVRKSRRGPRSRSSQYRGVTFYRRTGRWESHIWDCGKQVYLGGFDTAHAAARAYDKAAVKFRGVDADINFGVSDYEEDMKQTRNLTKEEFVQTLRRQSNGFSRSNSKYRGVTTLQKCGRWEAQTGQLIGNKGIQCNEGVSNLQPRMYQGEIVSNTNNIDGSEHNLDLSLGISMSSNGTKRNYPLVWKACDIPNRVVRPKAVDNSASDGGQIPIVSTMASKYPTTCSGGIYPGLLPKHEEKAKEKSDEAVSSPRLMNWAWQVQSNTSHNVAPMPMFSIAASSGFPSSTNYLPPANVLPLNRQSNFAHNLFSPKSTTFATENSHSSFKY